MVSARFSSSIFQSLQSTGLRQSLLVVLGNAFSQGLSAIALILITRQLGPTNFGEFSVGFAILLMLNRLNDMGLSFVIQRYATQAASHAEASRIFSYTIKIKLVIAAAIALIGLVVFQPLASLLNFEQPGVILAAFLLSGATVFYEQLLAMLQSMHRFSQAVSANLIQAATKLGGAVVLFLTASTGSLPIFIWYMSAPISAWLLYKKLVPRWVKLDLKQDFSAEHALTRKMTGHAAVGLMAAGIIENVDILFVQGYLNTYEAGLLGGVTRIALLFNLMAFSLSTVLNPRVAKYRQLRHLRSYVKKAWLVVGASIIGFLMYLPFSQALITYTIGPEYLSGSSILTILMAASFLSIAVIPFIALFFSLDHPWFFSLTGVLQLVVILGGNYLFVPVYGAEAAAWTRLAARGMLLALTIGLAWWALNRKAREESREVVT